VPVAIDTPSAEPEIADLRERRLRRGSIRERGKRLKIGLVNNMPDAAWSTTERQFAGLLNEAADDFDIRLSLWTLETLDRQVETRREMAGRYRAAREIRGAERDALIVTGAEPRAPDLRQEPYWRELTALFDWAEARTFSTVLSCLAAHASVLHRDGIVRRRLAAKCSGVFTTEVVGRHEIVAGFGPSAATPHSRWNGLDEDELEAKGYVTLMRSERAGVDMFVKQGLSLGVFLQGHPEYDGDTLAREYRRDLQRFLRGAGAPPQIPHDYFPPPLAEHLAAFAERATASSNFPPEALAMTSARWRGASVLLFRNWLAAVARRKAALNAPSSAARWGG
jgi:homoserine O-succinyltransferase